MFKQIVVGVDEDHDSRDATAIAENLLASDGQLTLVHVDTDYPHPHRAVGSADEVTKRQRRALAPLARAVHESRVPARIRVSRAHSVGRGLHEFCETIGADLLVVGSSRRGPLGRVLVGDDTRAALTHAPCAIVIAPAGYLAQSARMLEIGVGYDGSPESQHALRLARTLAVGSGAKLSAFEAITVPSTALSTGPLPFDEMVSTLVAEARQRIAAFGDVEPHAAYGHPAEELAVYSASLDLLVVGSRGYGPIGRLIHGGTAQALARTARCPLLVLPGAATAIEPQEVVDAGREIAAEVHG